MVQKISHRVIRMLRRLGYLEADLDTPVAAGHEPLVDDAPELIRTMAASVQQRIAFGERAGQKARRIGSGFGVAGERPLTGPRCARVHGFSLHANAQVPAHRRDQLERLLRDTARGAVSMERLKKEANGDLLYTFTHPLVGQDDWIRLSPVELLEKLAALVPLPRIHLVRYGGFLAPHSHLRGAIIPTAPTGRGGTGGQHGIAALELGTATEARLCGGHGALPAVSAGDAADHCRHDAGRGDPDDPPASEARGGPTPIAPARVRQEAFAWSSS